MEELDPIKIVVQGTDKVIKDMKDIDEGSKKALESISSIQKAKFDGLRAEIELLKKAVETLTADAAKSKDSLESIDKGVKFANLKSAATQIKNSLIEIGKTALLTGKSASENVTSVANSIAGIASQFGPYGVAISFTINLLTPLIAKTLELTAAQKAVIEATKEYSVEVGKNTAVVNASFEILKDNTSTYIEKKKALTELRKVLPLYLDDLKAEGTSLSKLNELQSASIILVRKLALAKAFADKIAAQQAIIIQNQIDGEIKNGAKLKQRRKELLAAGIAQIEVDRILSEQVNAGAGEYGAYGKAIETATKNIKALEAAEKSLNEQLEASLTPEQKAAVAKIEAAGDRSARTADAQSFKPVELFGENYQEQLAELQDLLKEGLLSVEDFDKAFVKLRISRDKYLASLAKDEKKATALLEERKKIEQEILDLETGFQKQGLFAIRFGEGTAEAAGLTGDAYKKAKKEIVNIADAVRYGIISTSEAIDTLSKLSFASQSKGLQDLFKKYDSTNKQVAQKTANLAVVQAKINNESNATFIREKIKTDKELENLEADRIKLQEETIKRSAKAQIAADDARGQQAILTFEESLKSFNEAYKQSIIKFQEENERTYAQVLSANTKFTKDIFTQNADGFIDVNEQALIDLAVGLSKADQALLDQRVLDAENLNKQLYAKQLENNRQRKELAENFIKDNNITLQKFQSSEIQENLRRNNRTLEDNRYYQKLNSDDLKTIIEERRKSGKEQTKEEVAFIQTRLQQQLQLEEDSYKLRLEAETKFEQERIDRLRTLAGDDQEALAQVVKLEEDLERKRLLLQRETTEAKVKINNEFYSYIDDAEANRLKKEKENANLAIKIEQAKAAAITDVIKKAQEFANTLVQLLNQNNQNIIDGLNEDINYVEERQAEALNNIANLEDDLEGKRSGRREAVLQSLEQQREREKDLAREKIRLAQQVEKEEIKIRKRQQIADIANATINGALAITGILAATSILPSPAREIYQAVQIGLSAATTATQIALISSQKFAKGGFTGSGTERDETGHKVAGVVHNDEWVAPKWMVESPKFGSVINQLENARTKGFAEGGFTSPDFGKLSSSVSGNGTARLESMMQSYIDSAIQLSNRPIYTSITEVQNVSTNANRRRAKATI
jgi:hypothetical protein